MPGHSSWYCLDIILLILVYSVFKVVFICLYNFLMSHRLDATVRQGHSIGTFDYRPVRIFTLSEVGAGVVVLHTVGKVVRHPHLTHQRNNKCQRINIRVLREDKKDFLTNIWNVSFSWEKEKWNEW